MRSWMRLAIGAMAGGLLLTSCASINLNSVPMPGSNYGGGYDIILEFANVLNLPDRAKVVMDGSKIGVVTRVDIGSKQVAVTTRIAPDVLVPSDMHAVLQQATVLGDVYVALERPEGSGPAAPPLRPGGRIPIARTTSPPQLEDTIANLANFIGSGSIQRAQNTLIRINRVTPPRPMIRKMASRVATDLADVSNNIHTLDQWLNGLSETANVMRVHTPDFKFWFTPQGVHGFELNIGLADFMGQLLPSVGSVYDYGYWLVPFLSSAAGALESLQHAKWSVEEEYPAWRRFFEKSFLPQDKFPAINITSIIGPDGRELSNNVEQVLRMIGAVP